MKKRPWRLSFSWEHTVDRRERRRHSHTSMHADTHTHACTLTDTWHLRTHTHTRKRIHAHARADTHAHTHADTHMYTRTHTHHDELARTHTHARRHTHAHAHPHADTHMAYAEEGTPSQVRQPCNGGDGGGWAGGRRWGVGYSESISAHTVITTTENSRHGVQSRCMNNDGGRAGRDLQAQARTSCRAGACAVRKGGGACTVYRAKHAQGDGVWITRDIAQ